ncbi:MgtC/SapB family protein [Methylobacterium sp. JK268]
MGFIASFNGPELLNSAVSLASAFVFGTLIGAERQYRQRTAGLRTNVLVAVGAAAFVDAGMRMTAAEGAVRVISYVVSGIGFLGAGVIMKEGMNVRGLNTAATLWGSAAVGALCGCDLETEAGLVTVAVLAGNTLLRPLVNAINRIPIDETATEATYDIRVTVDVHQVAKARDLLVEQLEGAHYPVSEVKIETRSESEVELIATLVSTAIDPDEIDAVLARLQHDGIRYATWTVRTTD